MTRIPPRDQPTVAFRQLCLAVAPNEFDLHIKLNLGKTNAVMYAADLPEGWTANVSLGKGHKTPFITASTGLYSTATIIGDHRGEDRV